MLIWRAVIRETGKTLCVGNTYRECSDIAMTLMPWGNSGKGEVAPYYFMNMHDYELREGKLK